MIPSIYFTAKKYLGGLVKSGRFSIHVKEKEIYFGVTDKDTVKLVHSESEELTSNYLLEKIKEVDGAGSGLDADLLDSYSSSEFLLKSGGVCTGNIYFNGGLEHKKPFNFWSSSTDYVSIDELGGISTLGNYSVDIFSNAYRDSDGNVSFLGANGNIASGSNIELRYSGEIIFYGGNHISGARLPKLVEVSPDKVQIKGTWDSPLILNGNSYIWNDGTNLYGKVGAAPTSATDGTIII